MTPSGLEIESHNLMQFNHIPKTEYLMLLNNPYFIIMLRRKSVKDKMHNHYLFGIYSEGF